MEAQPRQQAGVLLLSFGIETQFKTAALWTTDYGHSEPSRNFASSFLENPAEGAQTMALSNCSGVGRPNGLIRSAQASSNSGTVDVTQFRRVAGRWVASNGAPLQHTAFRNERHSYSEGLFLHGNKLFYYSMDRSEGRVHEDKYFLAAPGKKAPALTFETQQQAHPPFNPFFIDGRRLTGAFGYFWSDAGQTGQFYAEDPERRRGYLGFLKDGRIERVRVYEQIDRTV